MPNREPARRVVSRLGVLSGLVATTLCVLLIACGEDPRTSPKATLEQAIDLSGQLDLSVVEECLAPDFEDGHRRDLEKFRTYLDETFANIESTEISVEALEAPDPEEVVDDQAVPFHVKGRVVLLARQKTLRALLPKGGTGVEVSGTMKLCDDGWRIGTAKVTAEISRR